MRKGLTVLTLGAFLSTGIMGSAFAASPSSESALAMPKVVSAPVEQTISKDSKPILTMDEAQKIAVKLFVIPEGYKQETSQYEDNPGRKVWTFRWTKNDNYKFNSIQVSIDADTGELRSYYKEDPAMWEPNYDFTSDFTREEAKKIAVSFIKKHSPTKFSSLQAIEMPQYKEYYGTAKRPMQRYNFRFVRVVNGIPFDEDGIWIDIVENGQVSNYNLNWSKLPSNLTKPQISLADAKEIFKKNLGLKLAYVKDYSKPRQTIGEPTDNKLVYQVPEYLNFYIDADTGEIKDFSGGVITPEYLSSLNKKQETQTDSKFVIEKGKLAKEDAMKFAEEKIAIPEGFEITSTEYMPDYFSGRSVWTFRYAKKDMQKDMYNNLEIAVAADNGEILRMNKFRNYPPQPLDKDVKAISYLEGIEKAKEFIGKVVPEKLEFVKLDPQPESTIENEKIMQNFERWYHFTRYVNDIAVTGEGIGISVDIATGEVVNFNQQFTNADFKVPKNILSEEKIHSKFFEKQGLKLSYFRIFKPGVYYGNVNESEIKLGYRLSPDYPRQFDAVTGEPIIFGSPQQPVKNNYAKDIKKHRYENAIKKVMDLNIMGGRTKDMFLPDKTTTKAEFVKALVTAKGIIPIYDKAKLPFKDVSLKAWYAPYLRAALAQGILTPGDKFNPNGALTLEDASIFTTRALGYEKLAKLKIYKKPDFSVIDKNTGYAAIANGLGIFPDKKDNVITRGEAAQVILNLLKTGTTK